LISIWLSVVNKSHAISCSIDCSEHHCPTPSCEFPRFIAFDAFQRHATVACALRAGVGSVLPWSSPIILLVRACRSHSVLRNMLPLKEEHVLLIRLSPWQKKLYNTFMRMSKEGASGSWCSSANPIKAFSICCKVCFQFWKILGSTIPLIAFPIYEGIAECSNFAEMKFLFGCNKKYLRVTGHFCHIFTFSV